MDACVVLAYNYFLFFSFFSIRRLKIDCGDTDTESGKLPWKNRPLTSPEDTCAPELLVRGTALLPAQRCPEQPFPCMRPGNVCSTLLCLWPPPEPQHLEAAWSRAMANPTCVIKVCHTCLCITACTQVFMEHLGHGACTPCLASPRAVIPVRLAPRGAASHPTANPCAANDSSRAATVTT